MTRPRYVRARSTRLPLNDGPPPEEWQSLLSLDQTFVSVSDVWVYRHGACPPPHFEAVMTHVVVTGGEGFVVDCAPDTFLALIDAETIDLEPAARIGQEGA